MLIDIRHAFQYEASYLTKLAYRSKSYWGYSSEFMEKCKIELSIVPTDIEKEFFEYRVAEVGNTIVGFYAMQRLSGAIFELQSLFIEPKYIGSGIGKTLMEHAKNTAKELGGHIITLQSDPHADNFYKHIGGVHIGNKPSLEVEGRLLSVFEISLMGFRQMERQVKVM